MLPICLAPSIAVKAILHTMPDSWSLDSNSEGSTYTGDKLRRPGFVEEDVQYQVLTITHAAKLAG